MTSDNHAVRLYIERYVKQDEDVSSNRRAIITDVIDKVREAIPDADQVEYLGSSYEGNATKNNSDFDVTVNIAPKGSRFQVENIPDELGYVKLRYLSGGTTEFNSKCIKGGYLSSKAVMQKIIQSSLDKLRNRHGGYLHVQGKRIKFSCSISGPAVTVNLSWGGNHMQLDVVASVYRDHVVGGRDADYVAKPPKSTTPSSDDNHWRQSFAVEQKAVFTGVDEGNLVHREAIKVVKTVVKNDPALCDMSSYVVKSAALILIRKDEQRLSQGAAPKSWDTAHTADRVLDIGKEMYISLSRGDMRDPLNGSENILSRTSAAQRLKWRNEIGCDGRGLITKIRAKVGL